MTKTILLTSSFFVSLFLYFLGIKNWLAFDPYSANVDMVPQIMPFHLAAAVNSLLFYIIIALCSILTLLSFVFSKMQNLSARISAFCRGLAKSGCVLAFVTLVTGSIWGKSTWNTWWQWDPRLTTMLILFFLYLGYIAVSSAFENPFRRDQATAVLGIAGGLLVPVIYFSVNIWNSIHQETGTKMPTDLAIAVLPMVIATLFWGIWIALLFMYKESYKPNSQEKLMQLFK